ncbi:MAG: type IV toxin-antitoxin system AbiEi family antitoxin domain-containing protein [Bdellovibrionaceae bacterium]|nr:type IV toxin-antitoxin system AbiEi family antitoxin domain-containing protein [Pseudobdellovibrionaceae bacterium]
MLKNMGLFTTAQAEKIGFSRPALSRMVESGDLSRVGRGLYVHKDVKTSVDIGFQIACAKFGPNAAIGGLSALFHYNLVEQVPQETWIIVSPETRTKEKGYRLMRTKAPLNVGVTTKNGYKIATVERALVEGLRFASKIGERTAIGAVRKAFAQNLTNEAKLGRTAKELGLLSTVQRFFEAIVA